MKNNILWLGLLAGLFSFSACKKGDDTTPTDTGTLAFHLHTNLDNNEVEEYGTVYTTDAGRRISLDLAQLYLSHIQLLRKDGSYYEVKDKQILQQMETEDYTIGEVPVGDYISVRFRVGFDATANKAAPSTNAVLLDHPDMWFSSSAQPDGYVFLHLRGAVDPTLDGSGALQPFDYKLGTANSYVSVTLPDKAYTVVKDQATFLHLITDYAQIFTNIDLLDPTNFSVSTPADNDIMPGTWMQQNLPLLFRYED